MSAPLKFVLAIAGVVPLVCHAHHSAAGRFDANKIIEIEGEVKEMGWRNPHSFFVIETAGEDGESVSWYVEAGAASYLLRIGINRDSIRVGDHIKIAGQAPLTPKHETFATNILTADGQELLVRVRASPRWTEQAVGDQSYQSQSDGDSSRPELGIFRVWSHTDLSPLFRYRGGDRSGFEYPLTASARAALERFNPAVDNPIRGCTPKGMPTIMEQPYPMEFVDKDSEIVLRLEEYDTQRVIHMDQARAPQGTPNTRLGYSTGRWQGRTLVVTTSHIDWPWINQLGIPQSDESLLVERFAPGDNGSRLDYELTITDPVNFTEPVKLAKYWLDVPNRDVRPFDCTAGDAVYDDL